MVREIYEAFLEAGASKATAGDAAVAVVAKTDLATTQDIARLETQMAELRADFAEREARLVKWVLLWWASPSPPRASWTG